MGNVSFFKQRMLFFLQENHPDLIFRLKDQINDFINERAENAAINFEKLIKSGIHQDIALEVSTTLLKEGLLFSKYNTIENILIEYYPDLYEEKKNLQSLTTYIISLIDKCEEIFREYDTSDGYVYNDKMETELLGKIELIKTVL